MDDRVDALDRSQRGRRVGAVADDDVARVRRVRGAQVDAAELVAAGQARRSPSVPMAPAAPVTSTRPAHPATTFGTTAASSRPIAVAAAFPAASTSRWSRGCAGDAGGRVRDQRDPQHLHAGLAGRDRLERRRHADQVAADGPHHGDLGRRLVVRPGELDVDTLVEPRVDGTAERAQATRVQVREVDEGGAGQRRLARSG